MVNAKIILFLFVFVGLKLHAQFNYNEQVKALHYSVLQLNINSDQISSQFKEENGMIYWLQAYSEFVNLHFGNSSYSVPSNIENNDIYISKIKKLDKDSPFYNFCLADIYLFSAYTYLKEESYFSAASCLIRAQRYIEKNEKNNPDFYLAKRHKLIQLAIEFWVNNKVAIWNYNEPDNIQKEFNFLLVDATDGTNIDSVLDKEAKLLGGVLSQVLFSNINSKNKFVCKLGSDWALSGPLETLLYIKSLQKSDATKKKNILSRADELKLNNNCNKLNLLMGNMYLNELNDSAEYYLNLFCNNQLNGDEVLFAKLKLSWHYFIIDDSYRFNKTRDEIKSFTQTKTESDKQALYEISNIEHWDKDILKGRLLFDGGNYEKALAILLANKSKIKTYSKPEKLEFSYRLARVYDEMGEKQKALVFYNMVIGSHLDNEYYYPAYAAYYSGVIYEQQLNYNMAITYFRYCSQLNSPIYSGSVHRKAANGIKRCEKMN